MEIEDRSTRQEGTLASRVDSWQRAVLPAVVARSRASVTALGARARRDAPRVIAIGIFLLLLAVVTMPGLIRPEEETQAPNRSVGTVDFSYQASGVKAPTGRKPEASKLWFTDGSWWGILFDRSRDAYMIYRFAWQDDTWVPTGVMVDDRNAARADVLWDGTHLYAVSGGTDPSSSKHRALLSRFSYDGARREFSLDPGFPIAITEGGAETFVADKAGDGQLWVSYTHDQTVYVTHSLANDREWTRPYPLPVPQAGDLTVDDISSVVAYDGHIGVMWSDQTDGAMYFASHRDGDDDQAWAFTTALQGPLLADDHLNLKALHDDPAGKVFAVVKTSENDAPIIDPDRPLLMLLVLQDDGTWDHHTVSRVSDDQTRPLLLVDQDHRELYVFSSGPCCSGGRIYVKSSSLDEIDFGYGPGEVFLDNGRRGKINNPTSTRQNLGSDTNLLVVASDDESNRYLHNVLEFRGPRVAAPATRTGSSGGEGPAPVAPATAREVLLSDGFERAPFGTWTSVTAENGGLVRAEPEEGRSDRFGGHLAGTAEKGSRAMARFELPGTPPSLFVGLDIRYANEGPRGGNAPILRLFDAEGTRLATIYRQNQRSDRVWVGTEGTHEPTNGTIEMRTWARVEVDVSPAAVGSTVAVRLDGQLVYQGTVPFKPTDIKTVQVGNDSKGQPFDIFIDNVTIEG